MFGNNSWAEFSLPRDLSVVFANPEYTAWTSFRERTSPASSALAVPPVLARLPYDGKKKPIDGSASGSSRPARPDSDEPVPPGQCVWMNPAYAMAVRMTDAFSKYGFCTAIRGAEEGGKVEGCRRSSSRAATASTRES